MSNAKKTTKPNPNPEETQAAVAAAIQKLVAQGKKEGMIRAADLNAQLEKLDLSQNSISNIYIFQHTNSRFGMKELDLSGNQIEDLSPMSSLMSIEVLDLSGNCINSVQPLMHLSTLRELYIHGNLLTEEQIAELQQSLPDCRIVWQ